MTTAHEEFTEVAHIDDLLPGTMKRVAVMDKVILIVNLNGTFHAVDAICPHGATDLSEGEIFDDAIECPLHGSMFNLKSGAVLCPPAEEGLIVYPVDVVGEILRVALARGTRRSSK